MISEFTNMLNKPDLDDNKKEEFMQNINENYKELKTLINSLEKDSLLKQLLEEIIEFVKELFNIPPFTFKLTASHQQQPPLTINIPKNCAQELNENNKDTSQGMILRYIN